LQAEGNEYPFTPIYTHFGLKHADPDLVWMIVQGVVRAHAQCQHLVWNSALQ
jgi:hypothetical protein